MTSPYAPDGLLWFGVHDRVWDLWWKRVQAPWVAVWYAEDRLSSWAAVALPPLAESEEVRIEARTQHVALSTVSAGVFRQNRAERWSHIGTIVLSPQRPPLLTWAIPPQSRGTLLGEYIPHALRSVPIGAQ